MSGNGCRWRRAGRRIRTERWRGKGAEGQRGKGAKGQRGNVAAAGSAGADGPPKFVITTVAGTGKAGFSGDGGPATAAQINGPSCVAMDGAGQIYFVDARNNRVRRVRTDGTIETVVGTGATEMQQGELPATQTNLLEPYGLHVDGDGNVYVFSGGHSKLFKVGTDGVARVIAGTGERGYSGDSGPATAAQLAARTPTAGSVTAAQAVIDEGEWLVVRYIEEGSGWVAGDRLHTEIHYVDGLGTQAA